MLRLPSLSHRYLPDSVTDERAAAAAVLPDPQSAASPLPGTAVPVRAARQDQSLQAAAAANATAAALSVTSQQVAGDFQTVVSAMAELRSSVEQIAGSASRAATTAGLAVEHAAAVTQRITLLDQVAEAIGGIVHTITSIAAQSRMLALNATIEAARADEAGRGFAVVAQEVKQLADRTAAAAGHVTQQINSLQSETRTAVQQIGQIRQTISEISQTQATIAAAVEEQTAVAGSIVEHVDRAWAGSTRISTSVAELALAQQLAFVRTALTAARDLLDARGGMQLGDTAVHWTAKDQLTGQTVAVHLPQVLIGGQWLGHNDDPHHPSVFVDEVTALVGGSTTVFQRLNPAGDMLRVATDVPTSTGRRNIATYIAAQGADGTVSSVLAQVLAGKTYFGDAVVAGRAYFTAYDPVRSATGQIIGMLYVGMPSGPGNTPPAPHGHLRAAATPAAA